MIQNNETSDVIPQGLALKHILTGHSNQIYKLAWSPDGKTLASPSMDRTIRLWDARTFQLREVLHNYHPWGSCIAWSPNNYLLASGVANGSIILWDPKTGKKLEALKSHHSQIYSLSWSPDGRTLASSAADGVLLRDCRDWRTTTVLDVPHEIISEVQWSPDGRILTLASIKNPVILLWNPQTNEVQASLKGHTDQVNCVAWSPDGKTMASGSRDGTVRLWEAESAQQIIVLESHASSITSVSFSCDGQFFASKSIDKTVRIWSSQTLDTIAKFHEPAPPQVNIAFHPRTPMLATLSDDAKGIRIWEYDPEKLKQASATALTKHYVNAKVVLVGDTGVGKTALAHALLNYPFVPTDSSHARHVWVLENREFEVEGGRKEIHEVLLWDLAGQPGYRIIHQLHLGEVAVALVVIDARSETDPFAGVRHWDRALRQAQFTQGDSALPLKKIIVAARCDRGGVPVSKARIDSLIKELGFDGYFETSARDGWGIKELGTATLNSINWKTLPKVNSTALFQRMKEFLLEEKSTGRLLSTSEDLYRSFLQDDIPKALEVHRAQFETCIGRLEARDIIRRFSFGNLVLLQAEMLDAYASAIVNAAKEEPEGLGYITEERVISGLFPLSPDERLKNKEQEKLLLIATVEDLLHHEIALREQPELGPLLVFPSQLTREHPEMPEPEGKSVVFSFKGPVLNIYATLVVRLSRTGIFKRKEMWKNAVTYIRGKDEICGLYLRQAEEGEGKLTLFFNPKVSETSKDDFQQYIKAHLLRRALPDSVIEHQTVICPECQTPVSELQIQARQQRGFDSMNCPVCDHIVSFSGREAQRTDVTSVIYEMDRTADEKRRHDTYSSMLQGKVETGDFDVFLCHNHLDKAIISRLSDFLKTYGILPWLDIEQLRPGFHWQKILEEQIGQIKSAAVFVGRNGIGPWQDLEQAAFLREFYSKSLPLIPVILPDCEVEPPLPFFLRDFTYVDFRLLVPNPMEQLEWVITGKRQLITDNIDLRGGR
jgi:GTPase SAR1 family protein/sugar lactone lactonase YvrE